MQCAISSPGLHCLLRQDSLQSCKMCLPVTPHYVQWTVQNLLSQQFCLQRENQQKHKSIHKFGLKFGLIKKKTHF